MANRASTGEPHARRSRVGGGVLGGLILSTNGFIPLDLFLSSLQSVFASPLHTVITNSSFLLSRAFILADAEVAADGEGLLLDLGLELDIGLGLDFG